MWPSTFGLHHLKIKGAMSELPIEDFLHAQVRVGSACIAAEALHCNFWSARTEELLCTILQASWYKVLYQDKFNENKSLKFLLVESNTIQGENHALPST